MCVQVIDDMVASENCAQPRRWGWTKRLAILFATVLAMLQFLLGLYLEMTLPSPPPGFASFGLAVMQGSFITAGLFALIGAIVGCLIDVVINVVGRGQRDTMPMRGCPQEVRD